MPAVHNAKVIYNGTLSKSLTMRASGDLPSSYSCHKASISCPKD